MIYVRFAHACLLRALCVLANIDWHVDEDGLPHVVLGRRGDCEAVPMELDMAAPDEVRCHGEHVLGS
jgi:hypothetical protein